MDEFLTEIDAFLSRTGMSQTAFGEAFAKDRNFIRQVRRDGRDVGIKKVEGIRAEMRAHLKGLEADAA